MVRVASAHTSHDNTCAEHSRIYLVRHYRTILNQASTLVKAKLSKASETRVERESDSHAGRGCEVASQLKPSLSCQVPNPNQQGVIVPSHKISVDKLLSCSFGHNPGRLSNVSAQKNRPRRPLDVQYLCSRYHMRRQAPARGCG
jgi:hypothetical protein